MKTSNISMLSILFTILMNSCIAQIKNSKMETIKVYGNCEKCKKNIETAANKKGIVKAVWNQKSELLSLSYDSTNTNQDEILKRVAYAGYDNEKYLAPDLAYNRLDDCCQYDRKKTAETKMLNMKSETMQDTMKNSTSINMNLLADVYTLYFDLKDALTKDDGVTASIKAKALFNAIDKVEMSKMNATQHQIWMKYQEKLSYDAEHIKGVTETEHQREHFISLSKNMYEVMKVFKLNVPVYYDFCPMTNDGKGATWLSLQQLISNPYLGKHMPTCGKVQETIK